MLNATSGPWLPGTDDPSSVVETARALLQGKVGENDPGLIIQFFDQGLMHPARILRPADITSATEARRHLADVINKAGMKEVRSANGEPSGPAFTGDMAVYHAAINALAKETWARYMPGVPDVCNIFGVTPEALNNVEMHQLLVPFNA